MTDYIGGVFLIFFQLLQPLFIGCVIYLIFYFIKRKKMKIDFKVNTLLHIYLYVICFITLIITVIGANMLIKAVASYKFGIPFSYEIYEYHEPSENLQLKEDMDYIEPECYIGKKIDISGQTVCFDDTEQKKGLVNGATLTISMLFLFTIHRIALYYLEKKEEILWLKKIYIFISLIGYSTLSVISIPIAIYLILNYVYFRPEELFLIEAPGGAVALALASIPLWIVFLICTFRLREKNKK